jgi:hypothetical protein
MVTAAPSEAETMENVRRFPPLVASGMRECVAGNPDRTLHEEDLSRMERLFLSLA